MRAFDSLNAELTVPTSSETPQNVDHDVKNVAVSNFLLGAPGGYARLELLRTPLNRPPEDSALETHKGFRRIECTP